MDEVKKLDASEFSLGLDSLADTSAPKEMTAEDAAVAFEEGFDLTPNEEAPVAELYTEEEYTEEDGDHATPESPSETDENAAETAEEEVTDGKLPKRAPSAYEQRQAERKRAIRRTARAENNHSAQQRLINQAAQLRHEANQLPERKRVLTGTLIGVREASDRTPVLAQVKMKDCDIMIMIAFNDFFSTSPLANVSDRNEHDRRAARMLGNSIGAEVPFVLLQVSAQEEGNRVSYIARGSRKAALEIKKRIAFFNRRPERNIRQGHIYPANIIAVDRAGHTMWVELGGCEVRLLPGAITYRPIFGENDLTNMGYRPGKQIPVYVNFLERDEETHEVTTIRLNAAIAEMGRWEQNARSLAPGLSGEGVITRVQAFKHSRGLSCTAWMNGFDVPVRVTSYSDRIGSIAPGTHALLQITRVLDDDPEHIRFACHMVREVVV